MNLNVYLLLELNINNTLYLITFLKDSIWNAESENYKGNYILKLEHCLLNYAFILNYYSPSVYNCVLNTFDKCVQHPSTLCKWYTHIDGILDFISTSLSAISLRIEK